jgi:ParB-like chromosome segregation protein Spo0J
MAKSKGGSRRSTVRRDVKWRDLDDLLLDKRNPRLPDGYEKSGQDELLALLAEDYSLVDLGKSIAANGYFSEEPLVTLKQSKQEKWVVIEGNRRLAALLLVKNPERAPSSLREEWRAIAQSAKFDVSEVPTLEYETREEVTPYLGFRHITGVLEWRPYQKGRYIAQLVEDGGLGFAEIARLIGSKAGTVREHFVAFALVRQARDEFGLDTSRAEGSFGVLRRAISDPNIRTHIGLSLDKSEDALAKPLKRSNSESLKELLDWMFGSKRHAAALKDSRDLSMLGAVLGNEKSIAALRTSGDLAYAFELSGGEEKRLIESLSKAGYFLDQSLSMVARHKKSMDVVRAAERCDTSMSEINRILEI